MHKASNTDSGPTKRPDAREFVLQIGSRLLLLVLAALVGTIATQLLLADSGDSRTEASMRTAAGVRHNSKVRRAQTLQPRNKGFFLEIATSASSERASWRTQHLEKKGWRGVCAVPFLINASARTCNQIARPVGSSTGQMVEVQDCAHKARCATAKLPTVSVDDLLRNSAVPEVIDYVSLDTLGSEQLVLDNFPFDRFCVRAWTVRHDYQEQAMASMRQLFEVAAGCQVREGAGEFWVRCPCEKPSQKRAALEESSEDALPSTSQNHALSASGMNKFSRKEGP